jgi:transcriptional regulator
MAAKKLLIEEQVLKLLKEGLADKKVAAKTGTTANHVWAIRVNSGMRPVTAAQAKIARGIVERKRRQAAR